ncbi:Membrane-bound lytic murein transglycosylase D [Olavius sp. associated proteobacterium Delta 1]|nr:Membrane-bound lytic murein transglycosylase D [Olavius sp. associated proteobacterium Delta 1]
MQFIYLKWKRILPVLIVLVVLSSTVCRSEVLAESDIFPVYPCIQPNVNFWLKVYTQYSSDQGVIHDKRQMDRIYGVIALVDPYRAGGRKINNKRIKAAKNKYKSILTKLMQGKPPAGPEEQRVAEQFGPDAGAAVYRLAMRNLRCQTGQKDRFREGLVRSGAYIDEIKQIFRDAGLPEELAYLPHVESSFNPKAYSKFGAAGMWQFTRATGKRFMKVGYTIDERRDPILSSHAATKLLRQNYRKLNTWPLAITAYNHGVTGMRRAKRKKGSYERIFKEYRSRIFKFASRNFYSEFLAAREAAINYRQYFGDLKLNSPIETHAIELSGYVSLPEVARHLNIDLAELRALNPALRGPVFRGQKYVPRGYRLQLPDRNDRDWNQLIAQLPDKLYRRNQKRSTIYTVRRGDTAGKIAKTHGVNVNDLIAVNNLDRRATIYVNQNLRIPRPEEKPILVAKRTHTRKNSVVQSPRVANQMPAKYAPQSGDSVDQIMGQSAANKKALLVAGREPQASNGKASRQVPEPQPVKNRPQANQMAEFLLARGTVSEYQPGEPAAASEIRPPEVNQVISESEFIPLLADIESDSREEQSDTVSLQRMPDEPLKPGDQKTASIPVRAQPQEKDTETGADSQIPGLSGDQQAAVILPESQSRPIKQIAQDPLLNPEIMQGHFAVERVSMQRGKSIGYIRVEAEETLGHYAEWLNVSASEIRRLNGYRYGRPLHLSQQIKIPLDRVAKENFEVKRFEFHQELAEDFFASYRVEKVLTYSIKRGDNIWTLSRQEFEVPLWLIKRYNGDVDFGALIPSQKLLIPIIEKNV